MDRIIAALSETSTWRGIMALLIAAGIQLAPDQRDAIITACMSVIGLINVFRKEKSGKTINTTAPVTVEAPATITTKG